MTHYIQIKIKEKNKIDSRLPTDNKQENVFQHTVKKVPLRISYQTKMFFQMEKAG